MTNLETKMADNNYVNKLPYIKEIYAKWKLSLKDYSCTRKDQGLFISLVLGLLLPKFIDCSILLVVATEVALYLKQLQSTSNIAIIYWA